MIQSGRRSAASMLSEQEARRRRGRAEPAPAAAATAPYVTPLVKRLAAEANLDLSTITGTGVGGRITAGDVRAAAGPRPSTREGSYRPTYGSTTTRVPVAIRSQWSVKLSFAPDAYLQQSADTVEVDVYGANPLAAEMRAAAPAQYARAQAASGNPPTLFAGGADLPPITGSGMAPELLNKLPWPARPAAARADGPEAAAIFERFGHASAETYEAAALEFALDPSVLAYYERIKEWGDSGE